MASNLQLGKTEYETAAYTCNSLLAIPHHNLSKAAILQNKRSRLDSFYSMHATH
uniref:Uncharacterized protein n=1 Tax=Rhizophora mucronata TaxID=61149 RepID=A0A2P2NTT1_RHIMU